MAKKIRASVVEKFRKHIGRVIDEEWEGDGSAYFTIDSFDEFNREGPDGEQLWEFHALNYTPETSHDIYELFGLVSDEFEFEEAGYGAFFVSRRREVGV